MKLRNIAILLLILCATFAATAEYSYREDKDLYDKGMYVSAQMNFSR